MLIVVILIVHAGLLNHLVQTSLLEGVTEAGLVGLKKRLAFIRLCISAQKLFGLVSSSNVPERHIIGSYFQSTT